MCEKCNGEGVLIRNVGWGITFDQCDCKKDSQNEEKR